MKKYLLAFVLLLLLGIGFAQTKPKQKEKPPTEKEMEEMRKEMEKSMEEMSPEDKKMMDSMGIKMPSMPVMPKMTDKQIAAAYEEEARIVPLRDAKRIAGISKTPVTSAAMPAFLQSVHTKITSVFEPYVNESADKIYNWAKNKYKNPGAVGNEAVGFWLMGRPEIALYVMSRACKDDPTDPDNLNNFSALLTMAGGEEYALPILDNLNKKFPKNSTILNNIGQAWFGLGEIPLAEKYLDSCIRIYASHSQANATKSRIKESKGEKSHAVEALRTSIHEGYSMDKESRLKELGHKLNHKDLSWDKPMPQDPLGLEKFNWPDYPYSVLASERLEKEWRKFIDDCEKQLDDLKVKQKRLEDEMMSATQKRFQKVLAAGQQGIMVDPIPRFAHKAVIKLKYLVDGKDGKLDFEYEQRGKALAQAYLDVAAMEGKYNKDLEIVKEKYEPLFGEGKPNPMAAACADENKVKNAFLKEANSLILKETTAFLSFMRRMYNDRMYYSQYTSWPEEFEVAKIHTQISWLNLIKGQGVKFLNKSGWCVDSVPKPGKTKLGEFEDMHCNYHSTMKLGVGTISSDCSKLTANFDLYLLKNSLGIDVVKIGWTTKQGDKDGLSFIDQFQTGRVELGVKKGTGIGAGPIRVEAKVGVSGFVEVGRHGISDAGLTASADGKIGTNVVKVIDAAGEKVLDDTQGPIKDPSVTFIGAEIKMSIQSGFSGGGKGFLKGIQYK